MNGPQPVEVDRSAPAPGADSTVDGRAARSAKTRNAIADALLDLLADGHLRPTAREIADRASVSVRSVYVHFDDLEDLFCVAARRHFARIAPMLAPAPATGSLAERARGLVLQRTRLYVNVGAVGRATRLHAEFSPTLARLVSESQALARSDLERVFAQELQRLAPGPRASALAVLDIVTGPDAWQTLREGHGLPVDAATECVADSIVRTLQAVGT